MIKEAYCSYEVSKLLKEKGFDEPTNCYYHLKEDDYEYPDDTLLEATGNDTPDFLNSLNRYRIATPTHQRAMVWLREVHHIFIYIEPFITTSGLHGYKPYCTKIGGEFMWINPLRKYSNTSSDTYEEAVEAALKYSLEKLIKEEKA